jgi:hypothetical protein
MVGLLYVKLNAACHKGFLQLRLQFRLSLDDLLEVVL